ncbi:MAG: chitobiase/beta-hexosaminidase C-terminal domain-containing protein, partial [Opitutaceae bacterium]
MMLHKCFLLPLGFLIASTLSAQTTTPLLNDNFTSGTSGVFPTSGNPGIGTQNTPTSAEWFSQGSSTANGVDTYTNGVGITDLGASASDGVTAYFEAPGSYVALSVGDTLTLTVNFNFSTATAQPADSASQFRMGLFNSGATATNGRQTTVDTGTTTTTTSAFSPKNYTGFYADFNPNDAGGGTDNSSVLYYRPVGANTNWIGSNTGSTQVGPTQTNAAVLTGWATDTYQAVLTLVYTSATTETVTFDIFDVSTGGTEAASGSYLVTGTSTGLVTSFDGLAVGGGNGTVGVDPITFTKVQVTYVKNTADTPSINPGSGTYTGAQTVTIHSGTAGASIVYTTDGSTPTESGLAPLNGILYTSPFTVGTAVSPLTINAIAFKSGLSDSAVGSITYTFNTLPTAPVIQNQPVTPQPVQINGAVKFVGAASGFPAPTYQWLESADGGVTWKKLSDTSSGPNEISGSSTNTLTISDVNTSLSSDEFEYTATNGSGTATSNVFQLSVTAALFPAPSCIIIDPSGQNLYVGDSSNNTIQKINLASGVVSLVAGSATGASGSADGAGASALFNQPDGLAMNATTGNLYVADYGNSTIRQITPGSVVTTFAGTAGNHTYQDGTGANAHFNLPVGIALDASGKLYVADSADEEIRAITPGAVVSDFAGTPLIIGANNGPFNHPFGVIVATASGYLDSGNIYVTDTNNDAIYQITPAGVLSTSPIAGVPGGASWSDGTGTGATFSGPKGLAADGKGNLYVADTGNNVIR